MEETLMTLTDKNRVLYVEDLHQVTAAKQTETSPYQQTASGYGSKLQTSYMIQLDAKPRWYRIYCICYSNVGSLYVMVKGTRLFIRNEYEIQDLASWHASQQTR
jgi:hypothetical protein